jgi:LPS export ABC transporter protein LptC
MRTRLLAYALLTLAVAGCHDGVEPRAGAGYPDLPADYVILDVQHYVTEDGIRRGTLNADTALYYADSAKVSLRKVHLLLYNETGQPAATLVSRTGQLDDRTNAMIARGNVVLTVQNTGDTIETQELHYDPQAHRIWSTVESTRIHEGSRLTGDGFTADDQMQHVEVTHPRGAVQGMKVTF